MSGRSRSRVFVAGSSIVRVDGGLEESCPGVERRSALIGALPDRARMALAAARQAWPVGRKADDDVLHDVGVSVGTCCGALEVVEHVVHTVRTAGFHEITPSMYATGLPNAVAGILASVCRLGGPNLTLIGYQAGLEAIVHAARQIVFGRAVAMLAGGCDGPNSLTSSSTTLRVRAGAAFLRLQNREPEHEPWTEIVGWSESFSTRTCPVDDLVAEALHRSGHHGPLLDIQLVTPHQERPVDYLAATAPMQLIEQVIGAPKPGLYALVAGGFHGAHTCVLLDKGHA